MKNLQINTSPIGAQEYPLAEKGDEDIYIYIYGKIPFYKYVYLQLDGVPKYFRTRIYSNLEYSNEIGKLRYTAHNKNSGSTDYLPFQKPTEDSYRYVYDDNNPLLRLNLEFLDLNLISNNSYHSFFSIISYNPEEGNFEYNPRWVQYGGHGSRPGTENYELYLIDQLDDLENTDDPITVDSKIHSLTSKLEEDGYYSITINFMS